ncbi:MAG: segregation/condensation protein A [Patescibacteria group bacterium]|nr:segregation/condensation protein A [Patescibacteria group bacterium]
MPFTVKTQSFEGPLDLLLDLIEKRKLFVSDVSLAKVTDDFIGYVGRAGAMPMGESAHFILVASTLLLIKSRSLLPDLALTQEEQGDIRDLETRLKIYQRIKDASAQVKTLFGADMIFGKSQAPAIRPVFAPDPAFTLERALASVRSLIDRLPKTERLPQVTVKKVVSLEETIASLAERIQSQLKLSFRQFASGHKGEKVGVIVSFLAMLELVKNGVLHVTQDAAFGDITMETRDVGVPRY